MPLTLLSQPFTNAIPRANIHKLFTPDLLHQVIKGTFKDHLVMWVEEYLVITHSWVHPDEILDDIDQWEVPSYQLLVVVLNYFVLQYCCHHSFFRPPPILWGLEMIPKLWWGYIFCITHWFFVVTNTFTGLYSGNWRACSLWHGQAFRAFLEFCYIAYQNVQDTWSLTTLSDAPECFHKYQTIFTKCGVQVDSFALPRQHFLVHYVDLIHAFGAPNGLCSSITESKHIKAVKEPWHHSSCFCCWTYRWIIGCLWCWFC